MDEPVTRRTSLLKLGGALAGGVLITGCSSESDAEGTGTGPAAVASGAVKCVLTPEQTEGPFYIPGERVRRNIAEGRPGAHLRLRLQVVSASTCKPIKGAAVDIWHCDALGAYSSGSRTFMRGIQRTGAKGIATFDTVYPGWYQGRAVHIHVKVHLGG